MKVYQKVWKQRLNMSLEEAWGFFSSPKNLEKITPKHLGFKITSELGDHKMYRGQIITYIVKPMLGIPLRWCTEITHIEQDKYFVDEQRFGPYSMWHHEHWFEQTEEGLFMTDKLSYAIPLGILGRLANSLFVSNKIDEIFQHRYEFIDQLNQQRN